MTQSHNHHKLGNFSNWKLLMSSKSNEIQDLICEELKSDGFGICRQILVGNIALYLYNLFIKKSKNDIFMNKNQTLILCFTIKQFSFF